VRAYALHPRGPVLPRKRAADALLLCSAAGLVEDKIIPAEDANLLPF
jgi:hypothetical protein